MSSAASAARPALSFAPSGPPYVPSDPRARPVDFAHVADRLARTYRFNATPGALSVLQHQVMGAEAIVIEGGTSLEAALFLHHDDHEFILGDLARPVADELARALPGYRAAWNGIKDNWDAAIFAQIGLPAPAAWTAAQQARVKGMDLRMQAAESRALFGARAVDALDHAARRPPAFSDRDLKARGGPLGHVWPPALAAERWFDAHRKFTGRSIR